MLAKYVNSWENVQVMKHTKNQRLQKYLAQKGLGSRREIEGWIKDGQITVDGKVPSLGCCVSGDENIRLRGLAIKPKKRESAHKILMYHKPVGEVCTRSDEEGRPTVFANLPKLHGQRWVAVGRLDINSSGLLLFTTDGDLANRLMHPSSNIEREYLVRVLGKPTKEDLAALLEGVILEDGSKSAFKSIKPMRSVGVNSWFAVTLHSGKYREVRQMFESINLTVNRLTRIRYGAITLPKAVRMGRFSELNSMERAKLFEMLDSQKSH
jgi:23S rRNA pseudouridine2605 synthase